MMKKLMISLLLAIVGITTVVGQDIKFDSPPNTISVKAAGVRSFADDGNDWRAGLAFPFLNLRAGKVAGHPTFATLDGWILTDARDLRRLYLGAGLDFPLYEKKHVRLGLTGGYSADFSNLEKIRNGAWGVGLTLAIRF